MVIMSDARLNVVLDIEQDISSRKRSQPSQIYFKGKISHLQTFMAVWQDLHVICSSRKYLLPPLKVLGGMDIFWNNTMPYKQSCKCCNKS